jgi:hypothetical protein
LAKLRWNEGGISGENVNFTNRNCNVQGFGEKIGCRMPLSIAEGKMAPSSNDDSVTRPRRQNDDGKTNSQHSIIRGHYVETSSSSGYWVV